jgi:ankyrin repeat protein
MKAKMVLVIFLCLGLTGVATTAQRRTGGKATPQRGNKTADSTISPGSCCSAKTLKSLTTACSNTKDCLGDAIVLGCVEAIKAQLEKGAALQPTSLFLATTLGINLQEREVSPEGLRCRLETVNLLLEKGMDVNHQTADGGTAMMTAALWGRTEVAALLISKGAKVNAKDKEGETALMKAVEGNMDGALKTVQTLLDNGADVNAKNQNGQTALAGATYEGKAKVVELLLARGADINAKNNRGWTPLMQAISARMPGTKTITLPFIQMLLANKADVNAKNNDGETVLKFARKYAGMYRDNTVVELLVKAGAKE